MLFLVRCVAMLKQCSILSVQLRCCPRFKYMEATCAKGRVWTPRDWSVYNMSVRTNNDVESWHTRHRLQH